MRILDVFPYNNEIELLELRINLLRGHVDHFIISEGNLTHTGAPREYRLRKDLKQLGLMGDDITVVEVMLPPKDLEKNNWVRENAQRDVARELFKSDDVAIVTDCDEIINPAFVKYYAGVAKNYSDRILRIPMWHLNGRADLQVMDENGQPRFWAAGFLCLPHQSVEYRLSQIRESYTHGTDFIRFKDVFALDNGIIEKAGWHFSWMGNAERMAAKFSSIADFNDFVFGSVGGGDNQKNLAHIRQYAPVDGANDPLGRKDHVLKLFDRALLPKKIFELEAVSEYLLPGSAKKKSAKTIIFYEEQLGRRGTTNALYDYAFNAQYQLGMNVFVAYSPRASDSAAIARFRAEFPIVAVRSQEDIQRLVDNTKADYFYDIEFGAMQGWTLKNVKYLVHSVFCTDPNHVHGDVYAVVSEAQSKKSSLPWVPHMVDLPVTHDNLREKLSIPHDAYVFGRHGGFDTFDVQFVKDAVPEILVLHPDVWFVFMNTEKFIEHPRVIHLDSTVDPLHKTRFINTCDAMLHARSYGETFGLACLEFASRGRPVFTFVDEDAMQNHPLGGSSHLDILEGQAVQFVSKEGLLDVVDRRRAFNPEYHHLDRYSPVEVMKKFKEVFLT